MALPKTPYIYRAAAKAIRQFELDHNVTGRKHFAPLLGFRGENASVQLSSALNYTTYNPATPKPLTVDHLDVLLHELGRHKTVILDAIAREHGGTFHLAPTAGAAKSDVRDELLEIAGLAGDLSGKFVEFKENDGVIDAEEAEELARIAYATRKALRAFEHMIAEVKED